MGYGVEEDAAEDYEDFHRWVRSPNRFDVHGYGFSGTRVSSSSPQARSHYHGATAANVSSPGSTLALSAVSDRLSRSLELLLCMFLNNR